MNTFKFIVVFVIFAFTAIVSHSQNSQINISGKIQDTTNLPVPAATIMLLNHSDSALINYTTSNSEGDFSFKNIKNSNYILKISHITYMPWQKTIKQSAEKDINLGTITMYPIAEFLMEVVIRDAKAPIFIKGDTVEYDARTFKVPPGSTVEDLLRRLPGIDVDVDGSITTMGKTVGTVYVDGKTFFGNDPTTVTQNLDAAAISKVQVYDEKSEQEKLTGISDGSKEKVMNLELKDEYKKGYFGKASIAYGTSDRWAARANFNWFNEKQQLSFIGYGNNINQTGLNWSDYSEFKGQSVSNSRDNGDFGFSGTGGGYMYYSMGGDYYFDGSGFTKNYGTGVNYNYFHKKVKFNVGYFAKRNDAYSDQFSNRQTFLTDSTYYCLDTLHNKNIRDNHNFSTRLEYEIDSNNTIILRADFDFTTTDRNRNQQQLYQNSEFANMNLNSILNVNSIDEITLNTLAIYRHKFKKKGRNFAISGAYNLSDTKNIENISNINEFFNAQTPTEQINSLFLANDKKTNNQQIKSSVLYVEPLSKRFSLLGFYNFRNENRRNDNLSTEPETEITIDSLKLNYQNNVLYNRTGVSVNYGYEGINISAGGALQSIMLEGVSKTYIDSENKKFIYNNFVPYFTADIEFPYNINLEASYSYSVNEPSMSYLFPMPDLTNYLFIRNGNPGLSPERSHYLSSWVRYWNNASMTNISLGVSSNIYDSQIVYNQTIDFVDTIGYVTTYSPENVNGGNSISAYMWTNFPIIKTKLTMNINPNIRINNAPTFINGIENITNSKSYSGRIGFNLTIGPKLSFSINGNISSTNTSYSIQSEHNQKYTNYSSSAGIKWQFLKKTFLEGNFNFNNYNNKKLDFDQNVQLLNISIRQVLGKENKFEIRLAAFDLLNQQQNIRQYASINYIEYRTSPTLARYFMLSVSYNLKGFDISAEKGRRR
ncbi:outer membrane beta-barrel protein [Bacteroidales bacterium OttesenSCG-928-I21]|nr:outer membrane beta-barrel protein [Bacteroidales bacterium OttesenSCG-928-I21]